MVQVQQRDASGLHSADGQPVLVLDRDVATVSTISAVLLAGGYRVQQATTWAQAQQHLRAEECGVILVDVDLDERNRDVLGDLRALAPAACVLVLAGYASLDTALEALRAGVYEYLVKPVDVGELQMAVARAVKRRQLESELDARVAELEVAHREAQEFAGQLRQRVEHATSALQLKVAELDEANQQLRESQAQHDKFVAMVAHEMRGTLNPVVNYAQLAKRPALAAADRDRYLDYVVEHAFRLDRLIADLQTATRLSTGQFALRPERVDVAAAVAEVVYQFEQSVRERRFSVTGVQAPMFAVVDRDRVVQAVRNLIDNAVKYSAEAGVIDIDLDTDGNTLRIRVGDYGAGIPEEEKQHIFDAFTRLGHNADVAGTGLGLYITRGIASAHGGALSVANRSSDGRVGGAIFSLTLPIVPSTFS